MIDFIGIRFTETKHRAQPGKGRIVGQRGECEKKSLWQSKRCFLTAFFHRLFVWNALEMRGDKVENGLESLPGDTEISINSSLMQPELGKIYHTNGVKIKYREDLNHP